MDNMYKYLTQELNEAQLELNTLSDVAESFFPPESLPGTTRRRRSIDEDEPSTTEHDDSLELSQHLPLVQDSSYESRSKTQLAMHSPFSIFAIPKIKDLE